MGQLRDPEIRRRSGFPGCRGSVALLTAPPRALLSPELPGPRRLVEGRQEPIQTAVDASQVDESRWEMLPPAPAPLGLPLLKDANFSNSQSGRLANHASSKERSLRRTALICWSHQLRLHPMGMRPP